jgi:hypothetical protein
VVVTVSRPGKKQIFFRHEAEIKVKRDSNILEGKN